MSWFANLQTRSKLLLGFGVICALLLGVSVIAYNTLTAVQKNERDEVDDSSRTTLIASDLRAVQNRIRGQVLDLLLTRDEATRTTIRGDIDASSAEVNLSLDSLKAFVARRGLAKTAPLIADLEKALAEYRAGRSEELRLVAAGKVAEAQALGAGLQSERFERVLRLATSISAEFSAHTAAAVANSQQLVTNAIRLLSTIAIVGVLFALIMVWVMNRLIAEPLARTAQVIQDTSKGGVGARLELGRRDEIGLVGDAVDRLGDAIGALVADAGMLAKAGAEGRLSIRADASRHEGEFRKIVQGVNDTLDAVIGPVNVAAGFVDRVAQDEIPRPIIDRYNGDFDLLKNNLNKMAANLRVSNAELQSGFSVLAASSSEILATVSQLAAGATETAAAVSETATTAEEVKQTADLSAQKARAVQEAAQGASAISMAGRAAVNETVEVMNRIRGQMETIAESVVRLAEQGQTIGEIIATVNDLAEQSNLLAVNAAIEATRAGESGKGFSVVAQEVRNLAEQSRQATTQVRTILMEVQRATSAAVMATEEGTKSVAAGVKQATEAGVSIGALAGSVNEAAQAATQIAASSQQQVAGIDQITSALLNIRQATNQNMAGTKQLQVSARELQEMGVRLKVLADKQRVEG